MLLTVVAGFRKDFRSLCKFIHNDKHEGQMKRANRSVAQLLSFQIALSN
jgi:hypothetical protein